MPISRKNDLRAGKGRFAGAEAVRPGLYLRRQMWYHRRDGAECAGSFFLRGVLPDGGGRLSPDPHAPAKQVMDMGILICGLNGTGKSTLGRMLALRLGYAFIDNEELYFPKTDSAYLFSGPRSKEEAVRLLEEKIAGNTRFVFAAVRGDYGSLLTDRLDHIVLLDVPKQIRSLRVRSRSFQRFGKRMLPGGDLYAREAEWFALTDSRPEDYVTRWLETVDCPVIRIDGTRPPEENTACLVSLLGEEDAR